MIRDLLVLFRVEARMQLRQPVTLLLLLLLPMLTGPGMVAGITWYTDVIDIDGATSPDGDRKPVPVSVPDPVASWIVPADALLVVDPGDAVASVVVEGNTATIHHGVGPRSDEAKRRLEEVLRRHEDEVDRATLEAAGIDGELLAVESVDLSAEGMGLLVMTLPTGLILAAALATAFAATDLFTGERERGTIETLLVSAADRRAVVLAKFGMVTLQGAAVAMAYLLSMAVADGVGWISLGPVDGAVWSVLAVAALAAAVETAAINVVVATLAPTYRSASFLVAPVMLVVVALGVVGSLPVELGPLGLVLPIGNLGIAVRDALSGDLRAWKVALGLSATVAHVALAVAVSLGRVSSEGALFASEGRQALRRSGHHGTDAVLVFLGVLLANTIVGTRLQIEDLAGGLVFSQVAIVAGGSIAGLVWLGLPLADRLQWRAPGLRNLALAAVIGLLAPAVGTSAMLLAEPLLPVPDSLAEAMGRVAFGDRPAWFALVVTALLPAVCEELCFRGVLLGLTRTSGTAARVAGNAALFALLHLSVHRLAPTGALGAVLALLAIRTGSLFPGMVVHFLNNALLVGLPADTWDHASLPVTLPLAATAVGLVFVAERRAVE